MSIVKNGIIPKGTKFMWIGDKSDCKYEKIFEIAEDISREFIQDIIANTGFSYIPIEFNGEPITVIVDELDFNYKKRLRRKKLKKLLEQIKKL